MPNVNKKLLNIWEPLKPDSDETDKDGWGKMGGYMNAKNTKLHNQFHESCTKKSDIFSGVSIWVNGYTEPSSDELRQLMAENGGVYQHSFSKTNVTHVIATNLPDSKIKNLKRNDKVVHPRWIVESVEAGRLLSIDGFLLYSVNKREGTVLNFKVSKSTKPSFDNASGLPAPSDENPSSACIQHDNTILPAAAPVLSKHEYSKHKNNTSPLKAGQDNFISEYYSNSRLHHLSMWKAELKKFADSIHKKNIVDKKQQHVSNECKLIMHIDLDSFFVSVSLKLNPELVGKPVAVCHSSSQGQSSSFSEIASCSYEARKYGCRNGMMLGQAKNLCPSLICVPYQFDEYRNVSQKFYELLALRTSLIEAVSCDEALIDISKLTTVNNARNFAEILRVEVFNATGCTASCGIGNSILIARLATRKAKPNGVFQVNNEDIPNFIANQKLSDLPGIGNVQGKKFQSHHIDTCQELQGWPLQRLQQEFGHKQGETLYKFCRGQDGRPLRLGHERKSVSAEINYGMRFEKHEEVERFMKELSQEVEKRLKDISKKASHITLKVMVRKKTAAPNPTKFMGHGICDNFSKSVSLAEPTQSHLVISQQCLGVLKSQNIKPSDLRGIGIQMTKLCDAVGSSGSNASSSTRTLFEFAKVVTTDELQLQQQQQQQQNRLLKLADNKTNSKQVTGISSIQSFLQPAIFNQNNSAQITLSPKKTPPLPNISLGAEEVSTTSLRNDLQEAPDSDWDPAVFKELPEEIRRELENARKLSSTTTKRKSSLPKSPVTRAPGKNAHKSPSKNIFKSPNSKKGRGRPRKIDKIMDTNKYGSIFDTMNKTKLVKSTTATNYYAHQSKVTTDSNAVVRSLPPKPVQHKLPDTSRRWGPDVDGPGFLSPDRIDVDVLNELPAHIRNQIWSDLKKTSVNFKSKSLQTAHHSAKISSSTHPFSTTTLKNFLPGSVSSAAQNVVGACIPSPSQLDASFLRAIPEEMRSEIMEESENVKRRKLKQVDFSFDKVNNQDTTTGSKNHEIVAMDTTDPVQLASSLSTGDIDQSILDALPGSIRDEILNAPKQQQINLLSLSDKYMPKAVQSVSSRVNLYACNNTIPLTTSSSMLFEGEGSLNPQQTVKLVQIMPEFYGASSCGDVKSLFRRWVDEEGDPDTEDIEEVEKYFHELLTSYNMETLLVLIKFLRRLFCQKSEAWKSAFNQLHGFVQIEMKRVYSGRLPVHPF